MGWIATNYSICVLLHDTRQHDAPVSTNDCKNDDARAKIRPSFDGHHTSQVIQTFITTQQG